MEYKVPSGPFNVGQLNGERPRAREALRLP